MINILLVEDNTPDAEQIRQALQACGLPFVLRQARSVHEAMDYLQGEQADVVISDISLPDAGAIETFPLLKQAATDVPVVLITGPDDTKLAITPISHFRGSFGTR
jgi:DNA-binding NarL/FixJ family response regulator